MVACLPVTFVLVGNSGGLEPVSDMVASIRFTGNDAEDAQPRHVAIDGSVDADHPAAGIELAAVTSSDPNSEAALLATDDVQNTGSSVVNADLDAGADGRMALAWTRPFAVFVTWGYFAGVLLMTARLAVGCMVGRACAACRHRSMTPGYWRWCGSRRRRWGCDVRPRWRSVSRFRFRL